VFIGKYVVFLSRKKYGCMSQGLDDVLVFFFRKSLVSGVERCRIYGVPR
jgi:hypothetical protein